MFADLSVLGGAVRFSHILLRSDFLLSCLYAASTESDCLVIGRISGPLTPYPALPSATSRMVLRSAHDLYCRIASFLILGYKTTSAIRNAHSAKKDPGSIGT